MTILPPKPADVLPVSGLVAVTQTALGCGLGLLLAGRLRRSTQKATAVALFSIGIISTLPLAFDLVRTCWNRPESDRSMRKRLESIRDDSGFSGDVDFV